MSALATFIAGCTPRPLPSAGSLLKALLGDIFSTDGGSTLCPSPSRLPSAASLKCRCAERRLMRLLHAARPGAGSEGASQLEGAGTNRSSLALAQIGPHSSQGSLLAPTPHSAAAPARLSLPGSMQPSGGVIPAPVAAQDTATPAAMPQPAALTEAGAAPSSMQGTQAVEPEEATGLPDGKAANADVGMELDASPKEGPQQDQGEHQLALQPGEQLAQLCKQLCQEHLDGLSQQLQAGGLLRFAPLAFLCCQVQTCSQAVPAHLDTQSNSFA